MWSLAGERVQELPAPERGFTVRTYKIGAPIATQRVESLL